MLLCFLKGTEIQKDPVGGIRFFCMVQDRDSSGLVTATGHISSCPRLLGTFVAFGGKALVCQFLASPTSDCQQRKLAEEGHTPSPVLAWWQHFSRLSNELTLSQKPGLFASPGSLAPSPRCCHCLGDRLPSPPPQPQVAHSTRPGSFDLDQAPTLGTYSYSPSLWQLRGGPEQLSGV